MRFSSAALLKSWSRREAPLMKTLLTMYPLRRLLMPSSMLILPQAMGVMTVWLRRCSINMPTSAPVLWSSLTRCVRSVRNRGRDRWQKAWLFTLFWAKSLHPEDRLISLIRNPCQGTTTNGLWCIRIISQSSAFCNRSKANVLRKLQCSSWTSFSFLVLWQYFRATIVLSLQPTSSLKLKTFGLLWLWFMANSVIHKVRDLLNEQMVT